MCLLAKVSPKMRCHLEQHGPPCLGPTATFAVPARLPPTPTPGPRRSTPQVHTHCLKTYFHLTLEFYDEAHTSYLQHMG